MTEQRFVSWELEDQTAVISMKGERQLNTLNETVLTQLGETTAEVGERRDVRAVVLRAEGRAFAAGADIASMEHLSALEAQGWSQAGQLVFRQIERLPQPTIALVQGFALGGGMELAMACDLRLAAEGTKFGQPEVTLGIVPGFGGTQRLPRLVGKGRALWLLLSGQIDRRRRGVPDGPGHRGRARGHAGTTRPRCGKATISAGTAGTAHGQASRA